MTGREETVETTLTLWRKRPRPSMQGRYVWMTATDWHAYATSLTAAFPQARYFVSTHADRESSDAPPTIQFHDDLLAAYGEGDKRRRDAITLVFDPNWEPDFVRYMPFTDRPDELEWTLSRHPIPVVRFQDVYMRKPEELQTQFSMGNAEIVFYANPDNKAHAALRGRFFRLLGKFASNRDQAYYRMPEREFIRVQEKGSQFWVGHDARAWALEDPRRMFFYNVRAWAFRPSETGAESARP